MTARFLALGDSYTIGEGVAGEEVLRDVLDSVLAVSAPSVWPFRDLLDESHSLRQLRLGGVSLVYRLIPVGYRLVPGFRDVIPLRLNPRQGFALGGVAGAQLVSHHLADLYFYYLHTPFELLVTNAHLYTSR